MKSPIRIIGAIGTTNAKADLNNIGPEDISIGATKAQNQ